MNQRHSILAPVGVGQPNYSSDVRVIQSLLNQAEAHDRGQELLKVDGIFGPRTQAALTRFQQARVGFAHPDAVADPGQRTMRTLNTRISPARASPVVQPGSSQHRVLLHATSSHTQPKIANWIARVLPFARACKRNWRVPIAVTIAQGALESRWGTQPIGKNNYFGVKGQSAHGSTKSATHEERHGKLVRESDSFRAYASLQESVDDFGRFLNENHRYRAAFSYTDDAEAFFLAIARAGYATKHDYQQLVIRVMRSHGIEEYDHEK